MKRTKNYCKSEIEYLCLGLQYTEAKYSWNEHRKLDFRPCYWTYHIFLIVISSSSTNSHNNDFSPFLFAFEWFCDFCGLISHILYAFLAKHILHAIYFSYFIPEQNFYWTFVIVQFYLYFFFVSFNVNFNWHSILLLVFYGYESLLFCWFTDIDNNTPFQVFEHRAHIQTYFRIV